MSAFQDLASPARQVEAAEASPAPKDSKSDRLKVEPARPSENATVAAAAAVGAAVPFDNPRKFAPPLTREKASMLSVVALQAGSGADFQSKVRQKAIDCLHFSGNGLLVKMRAHTIILICLIFFDGRLL